MITIAILAIVGILGFGLWSATKTDSVLNMLNLSNGLTANFTLVAETITSAFEPFGTLFQSLVDLVSMPLQALLAVIPGANSATTSNTPPPAAPVAPPAGYVPGVRSTYPTTARKSEGYPFLEEPGESWWSRTTRLWMYDFNMPLSSGAW